MRIVIDRIEGEYAVLDVDGQSVDFPIAAMPEGVGEGTVLRWQIDEDTKARVLDEAKARIERLKKRDTGEDEFEL